MAAMSPEDRARAMRRAADDVLAKVHGEPDAISTFGLVLQAVRDAVPDASDKEIKRALAVKRPITVRQRIRNWVSKSIVGDEERSAAGYVFVGKRGPVSVSNEEIEEAMMKKWEEDPSSTKFLDSDEEFVDEAIKTIKEIIKAKRGQ